MHFEENARILSGLDVFGHSSSMCAILAVCVHFMNIGYYVCRHFVSILWAVDNLNTIGEHLYTIEEHTAYFQQCVHSLSNMNALCEHFISK